MEQAPVYMNVQTSQADTTIIDPSEQLDLVLTKGSSDTRVVTVVVREYTDDATLLGETEYQAEFIKADIETYDRKTAGMSANDIVRMYLVSLWDFPLKSGQRTRKNQFGPGMLSQILGQAHHSRALIQHLVTVVRGESMTELHRSIRKGN